jgi:hypothetical protein
MIPIKGNFLHHMAQHENMAIYEYSSKLWLILFNCKLALYVAKQVARDASKMKPYSLPSLLSAPAPILTPFFSILH